MFGNADGLGPRRPAPAPSAYGTHGEQEDAFPHASGDRLSQLKAAAEHIEMQLGSVALAGRDTGSEARYYGLAKRLQRVRAELLKEQRIADEIQRTLEEKASEKQKKEEHRRMFRR
jgi:hypothetical protein